MASEMHKPSSYCYQEGKCHLILTIGHPLMACGLKFKLKRKIKENKFKNQCYRTYISYDFFQKSSNISSVSFFDFKGYICKFGVQYRRK